MSKIKLKKFAAQCGVKVGKDEQHGDFFYFEKTDPDGKTTLFKKKKDAYKHWLLNRFGVEPSQFLIDKFNW